MQLREHPLMTYHGVPNWPPVWMWRGGDRNRSIRGEVGVLKHLACFFKNPHGVGVHDFFEQFDMLRDYVAACRG